MKNKCVNHLFLPLVPYIVSSNFGNKPFLNSVVIVSL